MMVKMSVTLIKDFTTSKEMVHDNMDTAKEHGFKMLLAGNKLATIVSYMSLRSLSNQNV